MRSALAPAAGSGPVVGVSAVRADARESERSRSLPQSPSQRPAVASARTVSSHPAQPSPGSELTRDDPATAAHLQRLIAEREPSLEKLLLERDPWPALYTPLFAVLEDNVRGLVHDWNGRIPK